jgi:hypothetical protein
MDVAATPSCTSDSQMSNSFVRNSPYFSGDTENDAARAGSLGSVST